MGARRYGAIVRFLDAIQTRRRYGRRHLQRRYGIVVVDAQGSVTDNDPNHCVETDTCDA